MKRVIIAATFGLALLVGILFFVALSLAVRSTHPPRVLCIANLKQIDGATKTWMIDHQKTTNDIPTDSDLFGANRYIGKKPRSPSGGVYTLGLVGDPQNVPSPTTTPGNAPP